MNVSTCLHWVSGKLRSAVVTDIAKDFCDGTVLMELLVLVVENEESLSAALARFTDNPSSMSNSLENLRGVLACLQAEGITLTAKPLDIFRGKTEVILEILSAMRSRYDPEFSSSQTLKKTDILTGSSALTKQEIITDWARTVCEHTDSIRRGGGGMTTAAADKLSENSGSDNDTGFIEPSSNGSGGEEGDKGVYKRDNYLSTEILPHPRNQDESYQSIDVIEVDEKLVRADSKIAMSSESTRRACVYVSISMKYEVTDLQARDSFLGQATKNYTLSGCEVPHKDLHKLGLGFLNLLVTCSFTRSLRTKSVGIYSPFLLGLHTITISETRQLFAHVLRERVKLTVHQRPDHVKLSMTNCSRAKVHVVIPEGTVWQQTEMNGDSHVVSREAVTRALYPEETEILTIPALYLNKQGGRCRNQPLHLSPFVFRGPLDSQERLFGYSDPEEEGQFRFCTDCNEVIYRDMYGITYFGNRPYHLECGPKCTKCGLPCLNLVLQEDQPYCSHECYHLSTATPQYCTKCGYVLSPPGQNHRRCPAICRLCGLPCLDTENFPGPVCSKLCQDWDTSKNRICQGCAQPIIRRSTSIEIDNMFFHSIHCFKIRSTAPPLIIQRAMVRGRSQETQELRRLSKLEFEKRSQRRRDALRLRKEERERKEDLQSVMECISKIELASTTNDRKYGTLQPTRNNRAVPEQRTRSLSSDQRTRNLSLEQSRKRTNMKPTEGTLRRSTGETGSFLDLLFSSDEETPESRPCRQFQRTYSERSYKRSPAINFEKRKLSRGFPSGQKQQGERVTKQRSRVQSTESSDCSEKGPSRRMLALKISASKGSTGSVSSSSTSPCPRVEFERAGLFEQLRCEQLISSDTTSSQVQRQSSAPAVANPGSRNPPNWTRTFPRTAGSRSAGDVNVRRATRSPAVRLDPPSVNKTRHPPRGGSQRTSPSFESLLLTDDYRHPRSAAPSLGGTSRRTAQEDPLAAALSGRNPGSRVAQPMPSRPSVNLPPEADQPPAVPMSDAQRRYERRFSRTRTRSETPPEVPVTPTYPIELLASSEGYSLEMLNSPPQDTGNFTSPRLRASPAREMASTPEKNPAGSSSPRRVSHLEDALSVTSSLGNSNRNSDPRSTCNSEPRSTCNLNMSLETGRAEDTGLEGAADSLDNFLDDAFAELEEEEMVPVGRTTSLLSLTTTTSHSHMGLLSSRATSIHSNV